LGKDVQVWDFIKSAWDWLVMKLLNFWRGISGGATEFSPSDISGMKLWLKADSGITKDGSNKVSAWTDQSGQGNNGSQGTALAQPTWNASAQNSLPTVRFTDGHMIDLGTAQLVQRNQPFSIWFVFRSHGFGDEWQPMFVSRTATDPFALTYTSNNEYKDFCFGSGNPANFGTGKFTYAPGTTNYHVIELHYTGSGPTTLASFSAAADGVAKTIDATGPFGTTLYNTAIGGHSDWQCNMSIGEVIVYNTALDSQQKSDIRTYLNSRWGL
jgi:hypothetical protein